MEFARKAIAESPRLAPAHRQLVANAALAGDTEHARSALRILREVTPDISLQWTENEWSWSRERDQRNYVEAFRAAGLK
jgi:hypothetical protein